MVVYYQGENTANVKIYHITSGILLECSTHVFIIMKQLKQPQHYFVSKLHYSFSLEMHTKKTAASKFYLSDVWVSKLNSRLSFCYQVTVGETCSELYLI